MKTETKILITKISIWAAMIAIFVLGINIGLWKTGALEEAVDKYKKEHATTKAAVTVATTEKTEKTEKNSTVQTSAVQISTAILENILVADFTVINKSNGRYQYGVIVENKSGKTVDSWKFEAEIPQNCEISDSWNCNVVIDNNKVILTPVEYNATLEPGGRITNIGIVFASTGDMVDFQCREEVK